MLALADDPAPFNEQWHSRASDSFRRICRFCTAFPNRARFGIYPGRLSRWRATVMNNLRQRLQRIVAQVSPLTSPRCKALWGPPHSAKIVTSLWRIYDKPPLSLCANKKHDIPASRVRTRHRMAKQLNAIKTPKSRKRLRKSRRLTDRRISTDVQITAQSRPNNCVTAFRA
jgi:hypothetical protein